MKKFLLLLIAAASLEAGTVRLANNTSFKLRTVIRAADGTYLGEVVVNPQQTMSWNDYFGGIGTYNNSQTPYTVILVLHRWQRLFCVRTGSHGSDGDASQLRGNAHVQSETASRTSSSSRPYDERISNGARAAAGRARCRPS